MVSSSHEATIPASSVRLETAERLHEEGRLQSRAEDIITVLELRGLEVDDGVRKRVRRCTDPDSVRLWLHRAVTVELAEDIFMSTVDAATSPPPNPPPPASFFRSLTAERIRAQGRVQGRRETRARGTLLVLDKRGLIVGDEIRERVLGCQDSALVRVWFDRAFEVERAEDIFGAG